MNVRSRLAVALAAVALGLTGVIAGPAPAQAHGWGGVIIHSPNSERGRVSVALTNGTTSLLATGSQVTGAHYVNAYNVAGCRTRITSYGIPVATLFPGQRAHIATGITRGVFIDCL